MFAKRNVNISDCMHNFMRLSFADSFLQCFLSEIVSPQVVCDSTRVSGYPSDLRFPFVNEVFLSPFLGFTLHRLFQQLNSSILLLLRRVHGIFHVALRLSIVRPSNFRRTDFSIWSSRTSEPLLNEWQFMERSHITVSSATIIPLRSVDLRVISASCSSRTSIWSLMSVHICPHSQNFSPPTDVAAAASR